MGIACPMSPHGQRTIPQGIVSSIPGICPVSRVHGSPQRQRAYRQQLVARLAPCPSTGRGNLHGQSRYGKPALLVVTNDQNPKPPLETGAVLTGVVLQS